MVTSTGEPTGYLRAKLRYAAGSLNEVERSAPASVVDEGADVVLGVTGDACGEEGDASSAAVDALPRFVFVSRAVRVDVRARRSVLGALLVFAATGVRGAASALAAAGVRASASGLCAASGAGAVSASRSLAWRWYSRS